MGPGFSYFYQPNCTSANLDNQSTLGSSFGGIILGFGIGLLFSGKFFHREELDSIQILNKYTPFHWASNGLCGWRYCGDWLYCLWFRYSHVFHYRPDFHYLCCHQYDDGRSRFLSESHDYSSKQEQIKEFITTVLDRGVTEFPIIGGYTGKESRLLMVTISGQNIPHWKRKTKIGRNGLLSLWCRPAKSEAEVSVCTNGIKWMMISWFQCSCIEKIAPF